MTIPIKKAKLYLMMEGCVDCGTLYSFAWTVAQEITVQVQNRTYSLDVHRCGDCQRLLDDRIKKN